MALLFVFDIPFYHNFAPMELVQWLEKMHLGVSSKSRIPDSKSSHHQNTKSPNPHIITSSHPHINTSSHQQIIRSVAPMALLFVFDISFYHNFAPMELVQWLEKMHLGVSSKSRIPDSKSSHHQNTKSPNPHISTSSHPHINKSSGVSRLWRFCLCLIFHSTIISLLWSWFNGWRKCMLV
jgi:hypothetical protein